MARRRYLGVDRGIHLLGAPVAFRAWWVCSVFFVGQALLGWICSVPVCLVLSPHWLSASVFTPFGTCISGRTSRGRTEVAFSTFLLRCLPGNFIARRIQPFISHVGHEVEKLWLRTKLSLPTLFGDVVWQTRSSFDSIEVRTHIQASESCEVTY